MPKSKKPTYSQLEKMVANLKKELAEKDDLISFMAEKVDEL